MDPFGEFSALSTFFLSGAGRTSHDLDQVHLFQHGGGSLAAVKNWEVRSSNKSTHDATAIARSCSVVLLFFLVHGISEVRPQIKYYGLEFNLSVISDIAVHALNRKSAEYANQRLFLAGASPMLVLTREYLRAGQGARCTPDRTIDLFPNRARGQFPAYNNDLEPLSRCSRAEKTEHP